MERLLALQELDLAIDRLRARREVLESGEDVRAARAAVERAEAALGELRLQTGASDREVKRLEGDAELVGRKAEAEERRLYDGSVANPKELEAIQREVASLRDRRRRIEDELLDRMVEREDLDSNVAAREADLAAARNRLSEVGGQAGDELEQIAAELASRTARREQLLPEFDEALLGLYEDLRRSKRGVGAAALVDGVCQGCHQKLSAAEMSRLKHADLKRCEYCDRILVPVQAAPVE